uniref:Sodium/nucleoside cotransporter n=1 Tax=Plectus sambesii TaxID=2011161 RepID=A0A914W8Y5_9BILA
MDENSASAEMGKDVAVKPSLDQIQIFSGTSQIKEETDAASGFLRYVLLAQRTIGNFMEQYGKTIKVGIVALLAIALHVFLGFAIRHNFQKAQALLILMAIAWILLIYYQGVKPKLGERVYRSCYLPFEQRVMKLQKLRFIQWGFYIMIGAAVVVFFIFDTMNDRYRLVSLAGLAVIIALMFIFSTNPAKVAWRPVIIGCLFQFLIGLVMLRWEWGKIKFNELANGIIRFLEYTNNGTEFVYGFIAKPPNICGMDPVFAFTVLQVIGYFGAVVALLYYYGIVQWCVKKLAWAMALTMGTTAAESMNAVASILLSSSALLIKPYMEQMTVSELHAVMVSTYACIDGSLFAAYVAFGACPTYILSKSVMTAPSALVAAKLMYPETEESRTARAEDLNLPAGEETNALEAVGNGAVTAVAMIFAIVANLIVFIALLAFFNNVIDWFGDMLGFEGWTFEKGIGYIFFPFAFLMGVGGDVDETMRVAQLMGTKTVLNEFIAYQQMGQMVAHPDGPLLSPRAQMIATYALCGFSNIGQIGISMGLLGTMEPSKRHIFAKVAVRALVAGSLSCVMTACIAGVLVDNPQQCFPDNRQQNCFDVGRFQAFLAANGSASSFKQFMR